MERLRQNPIITQSDVVAYGDGVEVIGVFNPAAAKFNGNTILLMRVAQRPVKKTGIEIIAPVYNPDKDAVENFIVDINDPAVDASDPRVFNYKGRTYLTSISHLRLATSSNGIDFNIQDTPAVFPSNEYETFGLEDPRITQIGRTYYITYKAVSHIGVCTSLITTKDFVSFDRKGIIFCPENIDVVIFPEKINGLYYALTRPVPNKIGQLGIWIASSPDLINWGQHKCLMSPRPGKYDSARLGAGCVPIKTNSGWLEIYHAADTNNRYCLAANLMDLNDPSRLLAYTTTALLEPETEYETSGFFPNVVFSCGAIVDGDEITVYYGAADCVIAAAKTTISYILEHLTWL